jgi:hypothetical protein
VCYIISVPIFISFRRYVYDDFPLLWHDTLKVFLSCVEITSMSMWLLQVFRSVACIALSHRIPAHILRSLLGRFNSYTLRVRDLSICGRTVVTAVYLQRLSSKPIEPVFEFSTA